MDDYRGEYRTIHVAMLDDEDFITLSKNARHVLLTLKLELGRAGIDTVYPGKLEWHTGQTNAEVEAALQELIDKRWIEMENRVVWLRNGLKYEVSQNLNNPNHLRGIEMQLQRLPRYRICKRWCAYYRLAIQGVATVEEVRAIAIDIMQEYFGRRVDFDDSGNMVVIGEIDVPDNPANPLKRNENMTIADSIADTMDVALDEVAEGMPDTGGEVSGSIIQKQNIIQNINQENAASLDAPPPPKRKVKKLQFTDDDMQCAKLLLAQITLTSPGYAEGMHVNIESWANDFRLIRTADKRKLGDIFYVLKNFPAHPFWSKQIRSPGMMREKTKSGADRFLKILYDLEHPDGRKPINHVANGDEYASLANRYPANPAGADAPDGSGNELLASGQPERP